MTSPARRLWELLETVHDVVYFTDECRAAADALGLRGFWMGYVALRAAPLGPVGPAPVTALFHGFPPALVARALPDAWARTTPADALAARGRGAAAALRRIAGPFLDDAATLEECVDLAGRAAAGADTAGRALAAANQALPRPEDPVAALWQATTTLREHRGDGHVAVLVARGVPPLAAHLLKSAAGEADADGLRVARPWPEEDWDTAEAELRRRGWIVDATTLAAAGRAEHDEIEALTDAAAADPWEAIGRERTDRLATLLEPLADAVSESGVIPRGNPTGLSRTSSRHRWH